MKMLKFLLVLLMLVAAKQAVAQQDSVKKGRLIGVIAGESAFYVAGNAYLQFIWYRDYEPVPFHFYNDNKGWLQMDKLGHAYTAYYESNIGYHSLRWAGVEKKKALIWGGSLGLLLQTPVEIFDGLYEGYGFPGAIWLQIQ